MPVEGTGRMLSALAANVWGLTCEASIGQGTCIDASFAPRSAASLQSFEAVGAWERCQTTAGLDVTVSHDGASRCPSRHPGGVL
jgi:hypothetical protein